MHGIKNDNIIIIFIFKIIMFVTYTIIYNRRNIIPSKTCYQQKKKRRKMKKTFCQIELKKN